jgi:hypothetical protein
LSRVAWLSREEQSWKSHEKPMGKSSRKI